MDTSVDPQVNAIREHLGTVNTVIAQMQADLAKKQAFSSALSAALAELTKV
jgi:hypothetical protein